MRVWVTWTSPYHKGVTPAAHELRGRFNPDIQMRTRCGQRIAASSAVLADKNAPRCKLCARR